MEEVDVQKLPRKELLQLCTDNNIRTAGVKQDELVRLLQKKLHPPATNPSRVSTKTRIQTSTNSPTSSPRGKEKSAENTLPSPGATSQRRSLRPLVLVDDPSKKASPEPSPRKNQLSPNPGALSRNPIATKSNSPPAQRSDLLRKKVNALTPIGKLQAQQSDGASSVRGRNNVAAAAAPVSGIAKQAQERQPQRSDGAAVGSRSSTIGAPKKSTRSTSMEPVKRPGVKRNEASRFKAQTNPKLNAAYLKAAAKKSPQGAARATATAGSQDFDSVSEIATDAVHHAMSEDSDDARSVTSVASEPASRCTSRLHSPRTSTGSNLGRGGVTSPFRNSAQGKKNSLDSSMEKCSTPDSNPSATQSGENFKISPFFLEDDTGTFTLVGDAHALEISSFLNAEPEEINAAEGLHQVLQELEQIRTPEISTAGCQEKDVIVSEESGVRLEQDTSTSDNVTTTSTCHSESAPRDNLLMDIRESAPDIEEISAGAEDENSVEVSHRPDESPATFISDQHRSLKTEETISDETTQQKDIILSRNNSDNAFEAAEEGQELTSKAEKDEGDMLIDSTHDDESLIVGGVLSPASKPGANVQLVNDERSPLHQQFATAAASESDERERVHSLVLETAPLPHPDMERPTPITPMSDDLPHSSPPSDDTDDFDVAGEQQDRVAKMRLPCDEVQQDFEIKLRRDYNKDGSKKSNILEDKGVKVPLLQHGCEMENTHLVKRSFPSSILLWCSQLFSAIFGTRGQS